MNHKIIGIIIFISILCFLAFGFRKASASDYCIIEGEINLKIRPKKVVGVIGNDLIQLSRKVKFGQDLLVGNIKGIPVALSRTDSGLYYAGWFRLMQDPRAKYLEWSVSGKNIRGVQDCLVAK